MKKTIRFDVAIKGVQKVFKEGMGPGVFVTQEVSFEIDKKDLDGWLWAATLLQQEERVIKENVEVRIVDVTPKTKKAKKTK